MQIFTHDASGESGKNHSDINNPNVNDENHDTNISARNNIPESTTPTTTQTFNDDTKPYTNPPNVTEHDDAENYSFDYGDAKYNHDDAIIYEQLVNEMNDDVEDFEFNLIQNYKWRGGLLVFDVMLT